MREKIYSLLSSFGYPVFLQGTLNDKQDYPDSFFTYWITEAPESSHYDNVPHACDWGIWLYFYSNDPELVDSVPLSAKALFKQNGFVFEGKPIDAASDTETHTGTMLTCYYKEVYSNGNL